MFRHYWLFVNCYLGYDVMIKHKICSVILTLMLCFSTASAAFAGNSLRVDKEEINEGIVHGDIPEFLYAPMGGKQDDQLNIMVCKNYALMLYPFLDTTMSKEKVQRDVDDLFSDLDRESPVASAEKLLLATANYLHKSIEQQNGIKNKQSKKIEGHNVAMSFQVYANDGKYLSFEQLVEYTHDGQTSGKVIATNIDLATNTHLRLKDLFKPDADYVPVLQEYISNQQKRMADISQSFGEKSFNYYPINVTGNEQFCFDNRVSSGNELTVIFEQGDQISHYNVPMDILKDIVNEPFLKRAK